MSGDEGTGHRLGGAEVDSILGKQKGRTRAFENQSDFKNKIHLKYDFKRRVRQNGHSNSRAHR